jgi:hypothetical protein
MPDQTRVQCPMACRQAQPIDRLKRRLAALPLGSCAATPQVHKAGNAHSLPTRTPLGTYIQRPFGLVHQARGKNGPAYRHAALSAGDNQMVLAHSTVKPHSRAVAYTVADKENQYVHVRRIVSSHQMYELRFMSSVCPTECQGWGARSPEPRVPRC